MGGGRLDDGAHDEGAGAELREELVPVHLDVPPSQLGSGGVAGDSGQDGGHVLGPDDRPVQGSVQVPENNRWRLKSIFPI